MLKPGDTFGDYKVIRLLGKGGMGAVFLLQGVDGNMVAAKILDPESGGDHDSRRRFLHEAQFAISVRHPNLVQTYDVGEDPDSGLCYILMEYVSGGDLADRIERGPLPIEEATRIVYQIASVLELARQRGIVHRDIKPANIMFGSDGTAKLADLGIARRSGSGSETTTVTQTGVMIGTPAYMAPEQMLDSHNVDCRADIYSLGVVFYEMLTGERPNKDDTVIQLMAKALQGEPLPDVRRQRPEVSASLASLINLMCAMKAAERIATPQEVTTALDRIARGQEVGLAGIRRKAPKAVKSLRRDSVRAQMLRLGRVAGVAMAVAGVAACALFMMVGGHDNKGTPVQKPLQPVVRSLDANDVQHEVRRVTIPKPKPKPKPAKPEVTPKPAPAKPAVTPAPSKPVPPTPPKSAATGDDFAVSPVIGVDASLRGDRTFFEMTADMWRRSPFDKLKSRVLPLHFRLDDACLSKLNAVMLMPRFGGFGMTNLVYSQEECAALNRFVERGGLAIVAAGSGRPSFNDPSGRLMSLWDFSSERPEKPFGISRVKLTDDRLGEATLKMPEYLDRTSSFALKLGVEWSPLAVAATNDEPVVIGERKLGRGSVIATIPGLFYTMNRPDGFPWQKLIASRIQKPQVDDPDFRGHEFADAPFQTKSKRRTIVSGFVEERQLAKVAELDDSIADVMARLFGEECLSLVSVTNVLVPSLTMGRIPPKGSADFPTIPAVGPRWIEPWIVHSYVRSIIDSSMRVRWYGSFYSVVEYMADAVCQEFQSPTSPQRGSRERYGVAAAIARARALDETFTLYDWKGEPRSAGTPKLEMPNQRYYQVGREYLVLNDLVRRHPTLFADVWREAVRFDSSLTAEKRRGYGLAYGASVRAEEILSKVTGEDVQALLEKPPVIPPDLLKQVEAAQARWQRSMPSRRSSATASPAPAAAAVSAPRQFSAADLKAMQDSNPLRRLQKTVRILFPGWRLDDSYRVKGSSSALENLGYVRSYEEQNDVLLTQGRGSMFQRYVYLPPDGATLHFTVYGQEKGRVSVYVAGKKQIFSTTVEKGAWTECMCDLKEWSGKTVRLVVMWERADARSSDPNESVLTAWSGLRIETPRGELK